MIITEAANTSFPSNDGFRMISAQDETRMYRLWRA